MRFASAGEGGEKRVSGCFISSILLFSPVAVVRLMVGRLRVGICGDGGRKAGILCCGATNLDAGSGVRGEVCFDTNGTENLDLKRGLVVSLESRESGRMGSFSEM